MNNQTAAVFATSDHRRAIASTLIIAVGAAIALIAPWGMPLGAALSHSPALRACLFAAMGIAGLFFARRAGLEIFPVGSRHPVPVATLIGFALAAYLLFIDGFVFKTALPAGYRDFVVGVGLAPRLLYYELRSFNEGIVYQLFFGSTLVWLIGLAWRRHDGRIAPGAYWLGLILAHLINIFVNVFAIAPPSVLVWDSLRFVAPGVLWAYLYWRHGLATALVAHAATHVFLQPVLSAALA